MTVFISVLVWRGKRTLMLFLRNQFLEAWIFARRIPERTDAKIAACFAIACFDQVGQGRVRSMDIASLRLDDRQRDLCVGFRQGVVVVLRSGTPCLLHS